MFIVIIMIGTIVNTGTIILGSFIGSVFHKGIPEYLKKPLMQAMGLAATVLGLNMVISNMEENNEPLLFILSLVIGVIIGTTLRLNERVDSMGKSRPTGASSIIEGLTTAVLLFCFGTLSILGPINSALKHDHTLLLTNSLLDGITSVVLSSSFGIGIIISAPILFVWQGSIYLLARNSGDVISHQLLVQLSLIGGILIICTGLSILEILKIKILDFLPSLIIPVIYFLFRYAFGM